jgi:hypothetical protein
MYDVTARRSIRQRVKELFSKSEKDDA